jgi:hypothetical protein
MRTVKIPLASLRTTFKLAAYQRLVQSVLTILSIDAQEIT